MANHSCPGYSDVWPFCNNDFIFVMSTCRFLIRPGMGQGAGGRVPCYPCRACGEQHPNNPLLRNRGMLSSLALDPSLIHDMFREGMAAGSGTSLAIIPCANPPRALASKTTSDRHRQQIYSFAKRICSKKAAIEHRHMNCQKGSCVLYLIIHRYRYQLINSLWPGDAIWRHRTGSIFTHLMAFCLTAQAIT